MIDEVQVPASATLATLHGIVVITLRGDEWSWTPTGAADTGCEAERGSRHETELLRRAINTLACDPSVETAFVTDPPGGKFHHTRYAVIAHGSPGQHACILPIRPRKPPGGFVGCPAPLNPQGVPEGPQRSFGRPPFLLRTLCPSKIQLVTQTEAAERRGRPLTHPLISWSQPLG
jgi:hypothetical protein